MLATTAPIAMDQAAKVVGTLHDNYGNGSLGLVAVVVVFAAFIVYQRWVVGPATAKANEQSLAVLKAQEDNHMKLISEIRASHAREIENRDRIFEKSMLEQSRAVMQLAASVERLTEHVERMRDRDARRGD